MFIDVNSGLIIGSSISAQDHTVIIRTKGSLEFIAVGVYNSIMHSGGFNLGGIKTFMSKVEAGFINIDVEGSANLFGAIFRAASLDIKAEYINFSDSYRHIAGASNAFKEL